VPSLKSRKGDGPCQDQQVSQSVLANVYSDLCSGLQSSVEQVVDPDGQVMAFDAIGWTCVASNRK